MKKHIFALNIYYTGDKWKNESFKIKKNKPCGTCVELKVFPH